MTTPLPGYEEFAELGAGGTGTVTLARAADGSLVAIKRLAPQLAADAAWVAQYRAEADVLRGLRHPNIVGLRDYLEADGEVVIVMEFVEGASLRRLIESRGTALPEAALLVLKGSLLGLGHAHAAGIVHRDYKPENVLVTSVGDSRLLDFGIAVPAGEVSWRAGTPEYMAPEQWRIGEVSPATDVYAAAAVFFECLAGHPPFSGDQDQLRTAHDLEPPPVEEVPEPVRALVATGMAKDPARRFGDAPRFVAALEAAAVAGYGPDWEERGRRALAAAASAAIALLPVGALAALGGAAAGVMTGEVSAEAAPPQPATPRHHQRNLLLAGGAIGLAVLILLAIIGVSREQGGGDPNGQEAGVTLSSPSAAPGGGQETQTAPAATAAPSEAVSSSPTATATVTASATPTPHPSPTPTPSSRPTPTPSLLPTPTPSSSATAAPTPTPTPPPPPTVTSAVITLQSCTFLPASNQADCTFKLTFTTSGPMTVNWSATITGVNCPGRPPPASQTFTPSGSTTTNQATVSETFNFDPQSKNDSASVSAGSQTGSDNGWSDGTPVC